MIWLDYHPSSRGGSRSVDQGVVRPCFPPLPQEARSNIPLLGWHLLLEGPVYFFCYPTELPASPSGSSVAITLVRLNQVQVDEKTMMQQLGQTEKKEKNPKK